MIKECHRSPGCGWEVDGEYSCYCIKSNNKIDKIKEILDNFCGSDWEIKVKSAEYLSTPYVQLIEVINNIKKIIGEIENE